MRVVDTEATEAGREPLSDESPLRGKFPKVGQVPKKEGVPSRLLWIMIGGIGFAVGARLLEKWWPRQPMLVVPPPPQAPKPDWDFEVEV